MEELSLEENALLIVMLLRRIRRRRRQRAMWMHPLTSERLSDGQYYTIMHKLRGDNDKFFNYFRMSQGTFDQLLSVLEPHITKKDTLMRRSIPAEERLAITLRYLASGCSFQDIHYEYKCGASTAGEIVYEVCVKIWLHIRDLCFPKFLEEEWIKIAEDFKSCANFPNCIGAIDGKHVRIVKPQFSGSQYFNYKKFFSMVLMAVCDANYRFTFIDVGSYGKASDSTVFQNSELHQKMLNKSLNIPSDKPISSNGNALPFVFVGDEAFGLAKHMLRPYGGNNLSEKKKIFNYRLSRARRHIECAFGILSNKWRVFHRAMAVNVDKAEIIIKACCTLHNFVRERDGNGRDHEMSIDPVGLVDNENNPGVNIRSAFTIRDKFADYFSSEEGSVPWQLTRINN